MMTLHVCENCGKTDYNLSRFRKHGPCNPESKTVWVSWGSGGRRRPNSPEFIEAERSRGSSLNISESTPFLFTTDGATSAGPPREGATVSPSRSCGRAPEHSSSAPVTHARMSTCMHARARVRVRARVA